MSTGVKTLREPATKEKGIKYIHTVRATLWHTNIEGTVSHDVFATLFGMVRELFAMDYIPNFAKEMSRSYLLETRNAHYEFRKNFFFGDIIKTAMWVSEIKPASFVLKAEFCNEHEEVYATGEQTIVFANLRGTPMKIPEELRKILESAKE